MCVSTKNTILLQTAKAVIYRPNNPHRRMTVRIILHGGSQRSHVTERVKNDMKLQVSHLESLTIKPFSSSNGTHQSCEVVNYAKTKIQGQTHFHILQIQSRSSTISHHHQQGHSRSSAFWHDNIKNYFTDHNQQIEALILNHIQRVLLKTKH